MSDQTNINVNTNKETYTFFAPAYALATNLYERTMGFAFYVAAMAATKQEIPIYKPYGIVVPKLNPFWTATTYAATYVRGFKASNCHEAAELTGEFVTYIGLGSITLVALNISPNVALYGVPIFLGVDAVASGEGSPVRIIEQQISGVIDSMFCSNDEDSIS